MPKNRYIPKEERDSDENFALCKNHISTRNTIRGLLVLEAEQLSAIEKKQAYKDYLGDEQATLDAYLAQPEIDAKKSTAKKVIETFDKLMDFGFIPEALDTVSMDRLVTIGKIAKTSNEADEMLANATTLATGDWKNSLREKDNKPVVDDGHEHNDQEFAICSICHRRRKVEDESHGH